MLEYAYDKASFEVEISRPSVDNALRCVELYWVADKYDFPELRKMLSRAFRKNLYKWIHEFDDLPGYETISPAEFSEIVSSLYMLPNANPSHVMVRVLWKILKASYRHRVFHINGRQSALLRRASEEVAEFGRDLFLYVLDNSRAEVKPSGEHNLIGLSTSTKVQCPHCDKVWDVDTSEASGSRHCMMCGQLVDDWEECEVWEMDGTETDGTETDRSDSP
jgi:hypothetical protein